MVRAYYIESGLEVPLTDLERLGVEYLHLDSAAYIAGSLPALEQLCASRHYKNRDEIRCDLAAAKTPDTAPAFEAMLSNFFTEHLHEDEEIRFVLEGGGFFDVKDTADAWIRIHVVKDDLIILPAGIFHRFSLDDGGRIRAVRLFQDEPKWLAVNRNAETERCATRARYLARFASVPSASEHHTTSE